MRCVQCGQQLGETAKFCPECGAAQTRPCYRCATRVSVSASECPGCGASVGPRGDARADGSEVVRSSRRLRDAERRQLTVMFCDLVASTRLAEALDPEDLRAFVRSYQDLASREVAAFGGHVAQLLGDGLLVYFGYPVAYEDAAQRAVGAALEIIGAVTRFNRASTAQPELHVRIGIHTGMVVVGDMGNEMRTERLAVGDTPAIASRIQALAQPDTVLLSGTTAELVARGFKTEFIAEHTLHGVREPITVHRVTSARDVVEEGSHAGSGPLVDRQRERERLGQAWHAARRGEGCAILLAGEAGIGKSRLVGLLRETVGRDGGATVELRCHALHAESAFHPFVEHLQSACGFAPGDGAPARLAKLTALVQSKVPQLREDLPAMAALLLLPSPSGEAEPGDPMAMRARIQSVLERWILAHAGDAALFVVEDLHWCDGSTLDVLRRVISAGQRRPMLTIMTARPEFELGPILTEPEPVEILNVTRLEREHILQIVENVSSGRALPSKAIDSLIERADGVPIFAEELTKSILVSSAPTAARPAGRIAGAGVSETVIPATLQDSLMARLDRLGPIRELMQTASVIGRHFDYRTLVALCGWEELELQRALARLTESDVLMQSGTFPTARFAFRHALLHEATYGALLRDARHELHADVGRIFEDSAAPGSGDIAEDERVQLLAYHWHRAVPARSPTPAIVEKAVTCLIRAAEQQLARSGYREAEAHLQRAVGHLSSLPPGARRDELELLARVRLSTVHKATMGPAAEQVREQLSRCRDLCLQLGNRPELGPVLYGFWQLNLFRAQYPLALTLASECRAEAMRTGDNDLLIQAHVALANARFWMGDLPTALADAESALVRYTPERHARHAITFGMDPGVLALMFLAWIHQLRGEAQAAQDAHKRLLELSSQLDHPLTKALALNTSCCFYVNERNVPGARAAAEALLSVANASGLVVYAMFGVLFRGWAMAEQGRVAEAIQEVRRTYHNYVTHVGGLAQTYAAMLVCAVYAHGGCVDDALQVIDAVLAVAQAPNCRELAYEAELLRLKGELLTAGNRNVDEASAVLLRAIDLAGSRQQIMLARRAAETLYTVCDRAGRPVDTARALRDRYARAADGPPRPAALA
jgi:class 3 adenylate cyclase/tetratricopeptide (TPR) repeat protein